MKPDYYTHSSTRDVVETTIQKDTDNYIHTRTKRTRGEHVMTYKVWKYMKLRDVVNIIGPLAGMTKK